MRSLSELVRIYCCTQPTDMRKSFDSLAALVRDWLGHDPLSGHLFVFRSRRGDRVKLLWWDRDGLTLYYRRLVPHVMPLDRHTRITLAVGGPSSRRILFPFT